MKNAVEELATSASSVMNKNGMRGTTGKNPSFFRTTQNGEIKCWMAVDSETGKIDIRDDEQNTLLEIDGRSKKAILAGLDIGQGITEAKESAQNANALISDLKSDVSEIDQKARTAQISADQALEDAASAGPLLLKKIRQEGLELSHNQRLTSREDGQLLINGKVFKGEKGETGKSGTDGKDGRNGRDGVDGKNGKDGKDGLKGDQGPQGIPGTSRILDFKKLETHVHIKDSDKIIYDVDLDILESAPLRLTLTALCYSVFKSSTPSVSYSLFIDGKLEATNLRYVYGLTGDKSHRQIISDDILIPPLTRGRHNFQIKFNRGLTSERLLSNGKVGVSYL